MVNSSQVGHNRIKVLIVKYTKLPFNLVNLVIGGGHSKEPNV